MGVEGHGGASRGAVIGERYVLEELVGRGGMADVYRARDRRLDRVVAVKVFRPGGDPEGARRLVAEARLLAPLHHAGIVAVSDGGSDESRPFLVMPLVTGGTLAGRLATGSLPVTQVARLGRDLANTLAYLHGSGIVHRDVKPSNVLLDDDGRPVLGDFGVSRLVDSTRLTTTGQIVGTAAYLAPEQVRGGEAGPAADVYALGLVLVECLTGRPVYGGTNQIGVATARLHREAEVPDDLPAGLNDVLAAMVATEPEQRPDAAACAERLATAAEPPETAATVVLPEDLADRAPARPAGPVRDLLAAVVRALRQPAVAAAAVALVAVAVSAAVLPFALGAGTPPPEHVVRTGGGAASVRPTSPTPTSSSTTSKPTASTSPAATRSHVASHRDRPQPPPTGKHHGRDHGKPDGKHKRGGGHGHGHGG